MLFGPPGSPGRDLAVLNIQRGREHGIPNFNEVRRAYGLPPAASFADVTQDVPTQDRLARIYGDVNRLDLWVGGLAEEHVSGSMLGETFHTIIADQFRRLRDGDRYWYENEPYFLANPDLLAAVRGATLADIIRRNTHLGDSVPDDVFRAVPGIDDCRTLTEDEPARETLEQSSSERRAIPAGPAQPDDELGRRPGPLTLGPVLKCLVDMKRESG